MTPSHAGPAPIAARNAGRIAVAVSWLQSLKRLVRPTPRTVRFNQGRFSGLSAMREQFTEESHELNSLEVLWPRAPILCQVHAILAAEFSTLPGKAQSPVVILTRLSHRFVLDYEQGFFEGPI